METKKSKQAFLEDKTTTFFLIGLLITLTMTFFGFEYKSSIQRSELSDNFFGISIDEPVIQTERLQKPIPKIPKLDYSRIVITSKPIISDPNIISVITGGDVFQIDTNDYEDVLDDEKPVPFPEFPCSFPGGEEALFKYLGDNIHYTEMARNINIEGTVYLKFTVGSDGQVYDVILMRGVDPDLDAIAIRAVEQMPKWNPAQQGIKRVPTYFNLPIKFKLSK